MSRSTNIEKLCNALGIEHDEESLTTYMDTSRKAPFRKEDLMNACRDAGIHVTTDMVKADVIDCVIEALSRQDKRGNAVYSAIRSNLKSSASKPRATSVTSESINIINEAISKMNALKVETVKKAAAPAKARAAKVAVSKK